MKTQDLFNQMTRKKRFESHLFSMLIAAGLTTSIRAEIVDFGILTTATSSEVVSGNAVGFVEIEIQSGAFELIRYDFEQLDGAPSNAELVIGDQLPIGTSLYAYDRENQGFTVDVHLPSGWTDSIIIERGMAFWIRVPARAPEQVYTLFLMGEVPDSTTAPETAILVNQGFNVLGYPYPVELDWEDMELAQLALIGSTVFIWDGEKYLFAAKTESGWSMNHELLPGSGFIFFHPGQESFTWTEIKPYEFP